MRISYGESPFGKRSGLRVSAASVAAGGPGVAGPNLAGTGENDAAVGTQSWASFSNITADDATPAVSSVFEGTTSHYLKATNFGFDVPGGATIDGIIVEVERYKFSAGTIRDSILRLVKGGVVSGDNKAATATNWPGADTVATYGSASDLWGLTLTPADVNASDFGVVLSVAATNDDATARVDYISITIHYTE